MIVSLQIGRNALGCIVAACAVLGSSQGALAGDAATVVSHIKVLSSNVRDVSSMDAWKRSYIKDGMTDAEKALAIWKTVATYRYQDAPPIEYLHEGCVHDPIKTFNVYGYGMCCCASSNIESLARYVGLEARGWAINGHSVPEVKYDGAWHMFDASLVNYFQKPDGSVASVEEIVAAVKEWLDKNPTMRRNHDKLVEFQRADGWSGCKKGPELLSACQFYDASGWWPAKTHGWYSTMQEFDGTGNTPFAYEYGYSQGYEVNIQLRGGERITRNWFHAGKHVNGILKDGDEPGCLNSKVGEGFMAYLKGFADLNSGRIGSGTVEYDVPLASASLRETAMRFDNLEQGGAGSVKPALRAADPAKPAVLEIRMPCSYVYLDGNLTINPHLADGGKVRIFFSDNNGGDWKEVATIDKSGIQTIDLQKFVLRRYDYRLRFVLSGKETALESLKIANIFQCSQRALPTLVKGENTITFDCGPQTGAVTIDGTSLGNTKGKNVSLMDFNPELKNVEPQAFRVKGKPAEVSFPIAAEGDITRLRFGGFYRLRDKADRWDVSVSFDSGKTFQKADEYVGPTQGGCRYTTFSAVPADTKAAIVKWSGVERNTCCLFSARIDADYKLPGGGFRPVKITYVWEEGGLEKQDVHIANKPQETYTIQCGSKPEMKSIVLELAP